MARGKAQVRQVMDGQYNWTVKSIGNETGFMIKIKFLSASPRGEMRLLNRPSGPIGIGYYGFYKLLNAPDSANGPLRNIARPTKPEEVSDIQICLETTKGHSEVAHVLTDPRHGRKQRCGIYGQP